MLLKNKVVIYKKFNKKAVEILRNGGIGVIPTDTIYGIVASALSQRAVERVYKLRKRDRNKKMIILIGSKSDLSRFGVKLTLLQKKFLERYWPGKVSVVLGSLAFRLPNLPRLRKFLRRTGPLVAPSANIAGEPPSYIIKEAQKYFGEKVDFYVDKGPQNGKPSTVVTFENGEVVVTRQGAIKIASSH